MRLVFAGTPDFARLAFEALRQAGHEIVLVLTQPDRPAGRGMKLMPSPVKQAALEACVPVAQPRGLKLDGRYAEDAALARQQLEAAAPEAMIVAAYGLILPQWVLSLPARGCLNIHASLLPRWRGAAPIQRAIEAGDTQTGVTIMQMDIGLDTGDMLDERAVPIGATQTAGELHDVLATLGAQAIVDVLDRLRQGPVPARVQPEGATYAAKLDKAEAPLDFSLDAQTLARRVRAFNPVPGATAVLPGQPQPVKVWRAEALAQTSAAEPGSVLSANAEGIDLATGQGVLRLTELQKAGGKRQSAAQFIHGWQRTDPH